MAEPQLENGYTRIANNTMEALAKVNLSPYESRVLWFILRKTYGWHKKADLISLSQIVVATGILKSNVSRAIRTLLQRNIVIRTDNNRIGFQKNHKKWIQKLSEPITDARLSELITSVIGTDNSPLYKKLSVETPQKGPHGPHPTHETITKEKPYPKDKAGYIELQETLRHRVGKRAGIDRLRADHAFKEWLDYLNQSSNKVGILMEAFNVWHPTAPPDDFPKDGKRMGAILNQTGNDAGYLLRILWETAAADIAGSHLNFIQGKLRKEHYAGTKGIGRQLPTVYESPEEFDRRTSRE